MSEAQSSESYSYSYSDSSFSSTSALSATDEDEGRTSKIAPAVRPSASASLERQPTKSSEQSNFWESVLRLPLTRWESSYETHDAEWIRSAATETALQPWVERLLHEKVVHSDPHLSSSRHVFSLVRLHRLLLAYQRARLNECDEDARQLRHLAQETKAAISELQLKSTALMRDKIELASELERCRAQIADFEQEGTRVTDSRVRSSDMRKLERALQASKAECERLQRDLCHVKRENRELLQSAQGSVGDSEMQTLRKVQMEYLHLVDKHKETSDTLAKTSSTLRSLQEAEREERRDAQEELPRLRQQLHQLQEENSALILSRDSAEELCERREADALRDMAELQQLHTDIIAEERQRYKALLEDFAHLKAELESRSAVPVKTDSVTVGNGADAAAEKRKPGGKDSLSHHKIAPGELDSSDLNSSATLESTNPPAVLGLLGDRRLVNKLAIEKQRLERENDQLSSEVQLLEIRAETLDAENLKLSRMLREYEKGEEGFQRLHMDLKESDRSVALLHEENGQLRERLNAMEDAVTFSSALQALCLRVGVTQSEIDQLRPNSVTHFSELETLRDEVQGLKEEIVYLEKERRHWMNKVRLQPLLDTKLRFELGLTTKQLKQLDQIVEEMKNGKLVVNDAGDDDYKAKYYAEARARLKVVGFLTGTVSRLLDEAARAAVEDSQSGSPNGASAAMNVLQNLRALVASNPMMDSSKLRAEHSTSGKGEGLGLPEPCGLDEDPSRVGSGVATPTMLREQLVSMQHRLQQVELTMQDDAKAVVALREQVAATRAERDAIAQERDSYRHFLYLVVEQGRAGGDGSTQGIQELARFALSGPASQGGGNSVGPPYVATGPLELPPLSEAVGERRDGVEEVSLRDTTGRVPNVAPSFSSSATSEASMPHAASEKRTLSARDRGAARGPESSRGVTDNGLSSYIWPAALAAPIVEEQLKAKDGVIQVLRCRVDQLVSEIDGLRAAGEERQGELEQARKEVEAAADCAKQLTDSLQEATERAAAAERVADDLKAAVKGTDSVSTRELLQKVVVLRQREAKLLERVRCAVDEQERLSESHNKLQQFVDTTFQSLHAALVGSSTGFVLPSMPSSRQEEASTIAFLRRCGDELFSGRLWEEDHRFLCELRQLYGNADYYHELQAARAELKRAKADLEELRCVKGQDMEPPRDDVSEGFVASNSQVEARKSASDVEADTWRQRALLMTKRLEAKEVEVETLESQLSESRSQLQQARQDVASLLKPTDGERHTFNRVHLTEELVGATSGLASLPTADTAGAATSAVRVATSPAPERTAQTLHRYQNEVARLKSINLSLLHYSLETQASFRSTQVQLEAAKQELQLIRNRGNGELLSSFVTAAIQEQAHLRRQSELALIQAKRSRLQLLATESNLRVAINEAGAYKLSAYRLYRTYAAQIVCVVDVVRQLQRTSSGSLSARQAQMLHRKLFEAYGEVERIHAQHMRGLRDTKERDDLLEVFREQLQLMQATSPAQRSEQESKKLAELHAALRQKEWTITELQEEKAFLCLKLQRGEKYSADLAKEVTRLEHGNGAASLNEDTVQQLLRLKETVLAKMESPPVAIQVTGAAGSDSSDALAGLGSLGSVDEKLEQAVRDYKRVLDREADLCKQTKELTKQLAASRGEVNAARAAEAILRDELLKAEERLGNIQRELSDERDRARSREARLAASNALQAEIAQKAAEHNNQCLRDMLAHRERTISELQEHLRAERQKHTEYQLEEAIRLEALHEQMFRENNAMVERFKCAIQDVAGTYEVPPVVASSTGAEATDLVESRARSFTDQLRRLTEETVFLRTQLKSQREANILLEAQLGAHISAGQQNCYVAPQPAVPSGPLDAPAAAPQRTPVPVDSSAVNSVESGHVAPAKNALTVVSEQVLLDLIRDQGVMIESLRQRDAALAAELHREQQETARLSKALGEAMNACEEQSGMMRYTTIVAAQSPQVTEDHGQLVERLREELRAAKARLEEEQGVSQRLIADSASWRNDLELLRVEVVQQQAHLEHAHRTSAMNEQLQSSLDALKRQNDCLIAAATRLKQRLIDSAEAAADRARRLEERNAVLQQAASVQEGSSEEIRALESRLNAMQSKLNARMEREQDLLRKLEAAQKESNGLRLIVAQKDREIAELSRLLYKAEGYRQGAIAGAPGFTDTPSSHPSQFVSVAITERPPASLPSPTEQPVLLPAKVEVPTAPPPTGIQTGADTAYPLLPAQPRGDASKLAGEVSGTHDSPKTGHDVSPPKELTQSADAGSQSRTGRLKRKQAHPQRQAWSKDIAPKQPDSLAVDSRIAGEVSRQVLQMQHSDLKDLSQLRSELQQCAKKLDDTTALLVVERAKVKSLKEKLSESKADAAKAERDYQRNLLRALGSVGDPVSGVEGGTSTMRATEFTSSSSVALVGVAAAGGAGLQGTRSPGASPANRRPLSASPAGPQRSRSTSDARARKGPLSETAAQQDKENLREGLHESRIWRAGSGFDSVDTAIHVTPNDVRHYKRQLLQKEEVIESLRRDVCVVKETEVRTLTHQAEQQRMELRRVVRELSALRGVAPEIVSPWYTAESGGMQSITGDGATAEDELTRLRRVCRQLEDDILARDNALIDLRFERESLALRLTSLQRHLNDIMEVDTCASFRGVPRLASGRAAGASGSLSGRRGLPVGGQVASLQALAENLKRVVEQLQQENEQLRTGAVSNAKYMAAVRELRETKKREEELLHHVDVLTQRAAQVGSVSYGRAVSQQQARAHRKLLAAQAESERLSAEVRLLQDRILVSGAPAPDATSTAPAGGTGEPVEGKEQLKKVTFSLHSSSRGFSSDLMARAAVGTHEQEPQRPRSALTSAATESSFVAPVLRAIPRPRQQRVDPLPPLALFPLPIRDPLSEDQAHEPAA